MSCFCWAGLLGGIMAGNISVATAAVADITSKRNRAKGMGLVGAVFGLGFIVGPVMGAALSKVNFLEMAPGLARLGINPFSAPALLALMLSLANLVWFQLRFKESLTEKKRNQSPSTGAWTSLVALPRVDHPGIRQVNGLFLVFIAAFSGMEFTLTFLAVERFQYTPAQNGFIFLYVGFFMVLIQGALVGRLTAKFGEKRMALYGLGFGVMALLLLSHSDTLLLFYASLTMLAVAGGLVNPSLASLVSLYSTEEKQGVNLGLFRSSGSFARAGRTFAGSGRLLVFWGKSGLSVGGDSRNLAPLPLLLPSTCGRGKGQRTGLMRCKEKAPQPSWPLSQGREIIRSTSRNSSPRRARKRETTPAFSSKSILQVL